VEFSDTPQPKERSKAKNRAPSAGKGKQQSRRGRNSAKQAKRRTPPSSAGTPTKVVTPVKRSLGKESVKGKKTTQSARSPPTKLRSRGVAVGQFTLGSDCTGYDSTKLALEQLGIAGRFRTAFCTEKDPAVRKILVATHPDAKGKIRVDAAQRNGHPIQVDLYSAGWPCQPFSRESDQPGMDDPRGSVIDNILDYLTSHPPRCFFLENVASIVHDFPALFAHILSTLAGQHETDGTKTFTVFWKILDTKENGVPQSRQRLFIVGVRNCYTKDNVRFTWPTPVACKPLHTFYEKRPLAKRTELPNYMMANMGIHLKKLNESGHEFGKQHYVGDLQCSPGRSQLTLGYTPCLTRNRCGGAGVAKTGRGGFYLYNKMRYMTVDEMAQLQGIAKGRLQKPDTMKTIRPLAQAIGNGFSVNVVMRILARLPPAVGLGWVDDPFGND
ncbi:unnamed protein product, partial [Prorocentrum cordatum]